MTDSEYRKKYPIGTKIKFINSYLDTGKIGKIVGYYSDRPIVYLPTADKHVHQNYHPVLSDGTNLTWRCGWNEIEPLTKKNEQLLFDFAYEEG